MLNCWFRNIPLKIISQQDTEKSLYEVRQCPVCKAYVEIYYYDQEESNECEDKKINS